MVLFDNVRKLLSKKKQAKLVKKFDALMAQYDCSPAMIKEMLIIIAIKKSEERGVFNDYNRFSYIEMCPKLRNDFEVILKKSDHVTLGKIKAYCHFKEQMTLFEEKYQFHIEKQAMNKEQVAPPDKPLRKKFQEIQAVKEVKALAPPKPTRQSVLSR